MSNDCGERLIHAPEDTSYRARQSVVLLTGDSAVVHAVAKITERFDMDAVVVTSPVTLIAFPQAVAQVADPTCGTRADWQLFVSDLQAVYRYGAENLAPLLLFGEYIQVDAMFRRIAPWKPTSAEAYHRDSLPALLCRVETLCLIRRVCNG